MKTHPDQIIHLLDGLKNANVKRYLAWRAESDGDKQYVKKLQQEIHPAESIVPKIFSLEKGIYHPVSPLLKIRFDYAGRWINAVYRNSFFSQQELNNIVDDSRIIEQVKMRQENWENSPPATLPWSQISLFGANLLDYEEIYLVWNGQEEPSVMSYVSNCEYLFDDLGEFLLFYSRI
jgi:hypothetical protein